MADQIFLCKSKNDIIVNYDPVDSHAATHIADTPRLKAVVIEVLTSMELHDERIEFDIDLGRVIGTTDVVMVDATDEIVYAVRKNRDDDEYVQFTKSRPAEPCAWVSIALHKQADATYELVSAWIGRYASPPFPGTKDATAESIPYWRQRAFVWGSQQIKPGTETGICPW